MREISHDSLLRKSRKTRNEEAIKRIARIKQFEDNPDLFIKEEVPIPKFTVPKVKKDLAGWKNFVQLIVQLKP